jgi:hypothetical protein
MTRSKPKITSFANPSFGGLEIDDPAFYPDGNGMGPIMDTKFGENALHVALHGFFRDGELGGDLFVRIPAGNQAQNLDFPRGQGFIGGVLGELRGHLGRDPLFAGMYQTDDLHQVFAHQTFEQVSSSAGLDARNTWTSPA